MLGISEAAESIGMRTIGVKISLGQLAREAVLPCIIHWNHNHFVVLYKIDKDRRGGYRFHLSDPASQKLVYSETKFRKCWISMTYGDKESGMALLIEPGPDFKDMKEETKTERRDLLFFARYLYPYKSQFVQLLLGILTGSGLQMIFPFLTQSLVDVGIQSSDLSFVTMILVAQLVLFVSQLSISFVRSWIMLHVNSRIDISLISDFLIKLMKLPLKYFDTKMTGDIMQRIGDHARIKTFLMGNSINILFSLFNFLLFGAILGYYSIQILGISLLGNSIYVMWVLFFMKYRRQLDIKRFNLAACEQSKIVQLIQGMQEIKLNNCERQKRWEWERIQVRLFKVNVNGLQIGQLQQLGSLFFSQTTSFLLTFVAAKSVIDGSMTLGMMMSLTYIIGQVSAPVSEFISFVQSYQDARISLERLNEVHRKKDEEKDISTKLNTVPETRDIRFEHVTFSYSGADRDYALDDVCLMLPEHKVTAVVGASGSGKTTLVKLILGFYQPNKGVIKIGETPVNKINPHVWRGKTGSVMQDGYIFSDTIAHNITMSSEHVDQERLKHAVKVSNIEDYINSLPLGYETKIGMEGNGLSQGQRQRLLIARAVYKNPDFIFLDEATNALDANNEKVIMENMNEFYRGKTVLIVAHRLSTVRNADNIIVLDKGKIVEQGTHEELTSQRGAYYNLIKNQLELVS